MTLTPKHDECLAWIGGYIHRRHRSPTYGEIARGLGVSEGHAHKLVDRLHQSGRVHRMPRLSRTIVPVDCLGQQ